MFREQFTGDGLTTTFQLVGLIENATFNAGTWDALSLKITYPSDVVNQSGEPIYDGLILFIRNRISVVSISPTGLVTLSHPPRSLVNFDVWYFYELQDSDKLIDYRREDFVASMEADLNDLEAKIALNTAKVSADGSVTTHSDVTSAGSGDIITDAERLKLSEIESPGISGSYNSSIWKSDINDQAAPPKDKRLEWNNVTQSNSTQLFIDYNRKDGVDVSLFLSLIEVGSLIRVQLTTDAFIAQIFEVTGVTDNITYYTYDVVNLEASGGNIIDNKDILVTMVNASALPKHASTHLTGGDDAIPVATISVDGLLEATDKVKLENLSGVNTGDDFQALVNNRKTVGQLLVSTLPDIVSNRITFPIPNPSPTDPLVLDFNGTFASVFQRHPHNFSEMDVMLILENSDSAPIPIVINVLASLDGINFNINVNSFPFTLNPRSGPADPSTAFLRVNEWVSPQPSTVPVYVLVEIIPSVANVVSVIAGSVFTIKGFHK